MAAEDSECKGEKKRARVESPPPFSEMNDMWLEENNDKSSKKSVPLKKESEQRE